jgi:nucleotide-binding universal stress UspA family protein
MQSLALKRVLCATDFSDNAAAARAAAVALARHWRAELRFLHVSALPAPPGADLIERLDRFGRPAIDAGVQARRVLRHGDPCDEIVREAEHAGVDLIVLGRHSRGTRNHRFLGSVAERVLRRAPCPVLVAHPLEQDPGAGLRHVLCAVDLGETSADTLGYAAALTRALGADLLVLHVLASPMSDPSAQRGQLASLVASAGVPTGRVHAQVMTGTPAHEILEAVREHAIDLVVVGSHGGSILDHQFLGSTTLHLLRRSECPVLVVLARTALPKGQSHAFPRGRPGMRRRSAL